MEWNEVKAKPKKAKRKTNDEDEGYYGGSSGGTFKAGPIKYSGPVVGGMAPSNKQPVNK
jgi:hypothetical protein